MNEKKRTKRAWPVKDPHKKLFPTHLIRYQGQWFFLFHALILLLIVYPYLEAAQGKFAPYALALVNSGLIMMIVYNASYNIRQFVLASFLAIPAIIFFWFPEVPYANYIILISTGLLYAYAIILIIPYLVHSKRVTTEEIFGTTSLYILLGFIWASMYDLMELFFPGSFYISAAQNVDHVMNWSDFIFFSFTTLTTLGYGDITPIASKARSLAIIEAITGVIFIASVLSRIISLYVAQTLKGEELE